MGALPLPKKLKIADKKPLQADSTPIIGRIRRNTAGAMSERGGATDLTPATPDTAGSTTAT